MEYRALPRVEAPGQAGEQLQYLVTHAPAGIKAVEPVPDTTVPGATVPATTVPAETVPAEAVPPETVAADTLPARTRQADDTQTIG